MSNVNNVPLKGSAPAGSPGSYTSKEQIVALLKGTDPGSVSSAGKSYVSFASSYEQMVANLKGFSNELAEAWTGPASNAAQAQLLNMHESAMQIFQQSDSAGRAVQAHGETYLSWYHSSMPTPKTTQEAQQWMQGANGRITQTWQAMPDNLTTKLPNVPTGQKSGWGPSGGSGGSGGGAGSGGGVGPTSGAGGAGHHSAFPSTGGGRSNHPNGTGSQHLPGNGPGSGPTPHGDGNADDQPHQWWPDSSSGDHRTDLSNFDPTGNGMNGPGIGSGPGSAGLGGGSAGGLGPGGSSGLSPFGGGSGLGPGGGSGIGVVPGPGIGTRAGGTPLSSGSSGSGAAGRSGAAGLPGTPGHSAGEDGSRERNRGAWLAEERSLWDGDVESVPGIIGEVEPQVTETPEEPEADTAALLQAALARIIELEARDHPRLSEPPS